MLYLINKWMWRLPVWYATFLEFGWLSGIRSAFIPLNHPNHRLGLVFLARLVRWNCIHGSENIIANRMVRETEPIHLSPTAEYGDMETQLNILSVEVKCGV